MAYGSTAAEPANPTRAGHTFEGWYADQALTGAYDFSAEVTGNLTLYAKWQANTYTVTFAPDGGSAVAAQRVAYGSAAAEPADPTRAGHTFEGWYADQALTGAYDFSAEVTGNLTLYAKWQANMHTQPVTGVGLDKATLALEAGKTAKLVATVRPDDATDKAVAWKSSDEKVATVRDGVVTGVKAGKATVTATAGGKSATCEVTVKDPQATPTPTPTVTVAKAAKPTTVAYPSKGKVAVSWKAAKGANTYQLQWRKAGAKKWATVSVKGKSKTVAGLKYGALYEFRVRGVSGKVSGKWSAASLRWLKGAAKAKAAPGKAKGSVKATWKADKAATGGFKVFVYAKKGGKAVKTKTVKAGATSATIKGLKSGKTYYVRVRPYRVQSGTTYTGAISGWRSANAK